MKFTRITFFLLLFLGSVFLIHSHIFGFEEWTPQRVATLFEADLGGASLLVEVAGTRESLIKGLSGRESIGSDGLLMVFATEGKHGIWMKDMNFAIDILWLDGYGRVVFIEEDVSPDTFPDVFRPDVESRFVLEVDAGRVERENWRVGSVLSIGDPF